LNPRRRGEEPPHHTGKALEIYEINEIKRTTIES
jgi:hypothetical protein